MKSKTELFVILARNAPIGVIFRRGPSKQVRLIKWNLRHDTFEHGQWLKGRIYERRCDLSPKGDKLIYFAAKYGNKKGPDTWTAISKPPYLTALAMWPNLGAWGGGGLFENEFTILLNHLVNKRELAKEFELGKHVKVRSIGEYAGRGEDNPIYYTRLLRDGWTLKHEGKHSAYQSKGPMSWEYTEPQTYEKRIAWKQDKYFLQMQIRGIGERQGDWYVIDYEVVDETGVSLLKLPRTSWADWDNKGNLLYAQHGKLYRLSWKGDKFDLSLTKELADFGDMKFESVIAPAKFQKW